jgi:hypothetical protein
MPMTIVTETEIALRNSLLNTFAEIAQMILDEPDPEPAPMTRAEMARIIAVAHLISGAAVAVADGHDEEEFIVNARRAYAAAVEHMKRAGGGTSH